MFRRTQEMMANHLFKIVDTDDDGEVTAEEWMAFFERAAQGRNYITPNDLLEALLRKRGGRQTARTMGLAKAEVGSFFEGPGIGELAPDFTLKTSDGRREMRLSSYRHQKPVVLIFGSYT